MTRRGVGCHCEVKMMRQQVYLFIVNSYFIRTPYARVVTVSSLCNIKKIYKKMFFVRFSFNGF